MSSSMPRCPERCKGCYVARVRRTETFRRQHDEILDVAKTIAAGLNGQTPNGAQLRDALALLASLVSKHAAQEDEKLYPLLFKHANDSVRETAQRLHREFGILYASAEASITVWSRDGAIEAEPQRCVQELTELLAALKKRIDVENDELYALIDAI
jgi:hemerythrin-like domain-containing protein